MEAVSKYFKISEGFQSDVEAALSSGLLSAEDQKLLDSFLLQMQRSSYNSEWVKTAAIHGMLVGGSMILWYKRLTPLYISTGIYTFSTACLVHKCYISWWKTTTLEKLQVLIDKQKSLCVLLQDSLQLVQENELLDRGFTMAQTGSSLSLLENTGIHQLGRKWHSMPGLWSAVYNNILYLINYLANATRTLISTFLLNKHYINKENFAAFQPASDLGFTEINTENCLRLSFSQLKLTSYAKVIQNEDDFRDYSQGIQNAICHKIYHTYLLLQSEFLASLAVCYYTEKEKQKILWLKRIFDETESIFAETITNLRKQYDSWQCSSTQDHVRGLEAQVQQKSTSIFNDVYVSVHSAVLHFQAMFHRTREVEGVLLQKMEQEQNFEEDFIHDLQMKLYNVHVEMGSCKSCIEEGITQVQKLFPSVITSLSAEPPLMISGCVSKSVSPTCTTSSYIEVHPQRKEEVLSVITTQEDFGSSNEGLEVCESLISEDKWYEKRQKELSQRVLLELKAVLDQKRDGWKLKESNTLKQRASLESGLQFNELTPQSSPRTLVYSNRMTGTMKGGSSLWNIPSVDDHTLWKCGNSVNSSSQTINVLPVENEILNLSPLKPGDNWPLPRLKKGGVFGPSSKSNGGANIG